MAQKRIQFLRLYLEELKRELEEGVTAGFLDEIE
jgi:hypothetical protein